MNTHNICFCGEIRNVFMWVGLCIILTHRIEVIKHLMHPYNLIVEFIITVGVWQKCVSICDKKIKDIHNLKMNQYNCYRIEIATSK